MWNQSFTFDLVDQKSTGWCFFECYDEELGSDDFICGGRIPFADLLRQPNVPTMFNLHNKGGNKVDGKV